MELQPYMMVIYGLLAFWSLFSIFYIIRVGIKGIHSVTPYFYDSIPSVFTTFGVLGTFVGIYFGLRDFDVENITESIPSLLEGLKTAFTTSIWGISLSLVFGKISQIVLRSAEKRLPPKPTDELAALQEIKDAIDESSDKNYIKQTEQLNSLGILYMALVGENDGSVSTQLVMLRNQFSVFNTGQSQQLEVLRAVQSALGGDDETSLLTQIQKLRTEQNEQARESKKNIDWIVESMNKNNELISKKFNEFSELLAKNNTEVLVKVMKKATEEFNNQMSALIEKLVQENFQELNNSVQLMNQWQKENKEMISELTAQFRSVTQEFAITSKTINEITENTSKLTDDNSHLTKLIEELQKVMIEDTKYQDIVDKLTFTIGTLKTNTEAFDETTNKLNDWVRNQMNFSDSVAKLLTRLEEIDRIKDINELFWQNTKKHLNECVGLIEKASKRLSDDIENINEEFYERLNDTLQSLDTLIQRIIRKHNG